MKDLVKQSRGIDFGRLLEATTRVAERDFNEEPLAPEVPADSPPPAPPSEPPPGEVPPGETPSTEAPPDELLLLGQAGEEKFYLKRSPEDWIVQSATEETVASAKELGVSIGDARAFLLAVIPKLNIDLLSFHTLEALDVLTPEESACEKCGKSPCECSPEAPEGVDAAPAVQGGGVPSPQEGKLPKIGTDTPDDIRKCLVERITGVAHKVIALYGGVVSLKEDAGRLIGSWQVDKKMPSEALGSIKLGKARRDFEIAMRVAGAKAVESKDSAWARGVFEVMLAEGKLPDIGTDTPDEIRKKLTEKHAVPVPPKS